MPVPLRAGGRERLSVRPLGHGVFDVALRYGFMEDAGRARRLQRCPRCGPGARRDDTTYFLGRETLHRDARRRGMAMWREQLFVLMARNAGRAAGFFRLPPERVVELGVQVEL